MADISIEDIRKMTSLSGLDLSGDDLEVYRIATDTISYGVSLRTHA